MAEAIRNALPHAAGFDVIPPEKTLFAVGSSAADQVIIGRREPEAVEYWFRRSEFSLGMAERATDPKVKAIHQELSELQVVAALTALFNPGRGGQ
jgi:hypothetical protein